MAKRIGYMFLDKQLTLVLNGNPYDIDPGHPNFKEIVSRMQRPDSETQDEESVRADTLLKLVKEDRLDVREAAAAVGENDVTIDHGVVMVKGKPLRNSLTKRILELKAAGLPYTGFVKFLVNLNLNPSAESRAALYDFLEQGRFPLTDDGCFLGYKGVVRGWLVVVDKATGKTKRAAPEDPGAYETLVDCHTHSFDMSPGKAHSMPWDEVDSNRGEACGSGFHIGTIGHARGFGQVMIVVKVNPKDAVSVPLYDTTKLRSCALAVVNIFADQGGAREFAKPVYTSEEIADEEWEEEEEEEYELLKPSEEERRAQYVAMKRDDICREAARKGIFASTNEARDLGKDIVVEALLLNDVPFQHMTRDQVAKLAVRRHLYASDKIALKAGLPKLIEALRGDTAATIQRMNGQEAPAED